jgi:hypothetical protein
MSDLETLAELDGYPFDVVVTRGAEDRQRRRGPVRAGQGVALTSSASSPT